MFGCLFEHRLDKNLQEYVDDKINASQPLNKCKINAIPYEKGGWRNMVTG